MVDEAKDFENVSWFFEKVSAKNLEKAFLEALASEYDSEIRAMIQYAQSMHQKGENVSAYWILHSFLLGIGTCSSRHGRHSIDKDGCERIQEKINFLSRALYHA